MMINHIPVMVKEVIEILSPRPGGIYIDATVGPGGHTLEILKYIGPEGKIIGFDRDMETLNIARQRISDGRVILKKALFTEIRGILEEEGITGVDGILFDFGISMLQVKDMERAFSFHSEYPLDMRMDRSKGITAEEVINTYPAHELERILREYGELGYAKKIARAIVLKRREGRIRSCKELADLVSKVYGRRGKIHPATKTFQALRIEVNNEINEIREGLQNSIVLLNKGGRLCVISYHSLEDRIVKIFMRDSERKGLLRVLTKKPLTPLPEEIRSNPASRSAKLRGAEKI
ncbi:MAG: 16S rRNA (cytosine(1402)-N(4))-methyltransferase RsmH [Thermodesulfovibrionales bacterium]